jgi:hypothetical protein
MPPLVGVFEEGSTYKLEGANDPLQKNMIKKVKKPIIMVKFHHIHKNIIGALILFVGFGYIMIMYINWLLTVHNVNNL